MLRHLSTFYDNFCDIAEERNTSPLVLAKQCGFSEHDALNWQHGCVPKGNAMKHLCDCLDVSEEQLTRNKFERRQTKAKQTNMLNAMALYCKQHNISYGQLQLKIKSGEITPAEVQQMPIELDKVVKERKRKKAEEAKKYKYNVCPYCGKLFEVTKSRIVYCSNECKNKHQRDLLNAQRKKRKG